MKKNGTRKTKNMTSFRNMLCPWIFILHRESCHIIPTWFLLKIRLSISSSGQSKKRTNAGSILVWIIIYYGKNAIQTKQKAIPPFTTLATVYGENIGTENCVKNLQQLQKQLGFPHCGESHQSEICRFHYPALLFGGALLLPLKVLSCPP